MRCLVYEPNHRGHRFNFLRHLLPAVEATGATVTLVTTREALATPQFDEHVRPLMDRVEVDAKDSWVKTSPQRQARRRLAQLRDAIARCAPEHVLVPFADAMAQLSGLPLVAGGALAPPGVELEGLMLTGRWGYPPRDWRDRISRRVVLGALARSPWERLHLLDPIPFEAIELHGGPLVDRVFLMPEPVEQIGVMTTEEARRRLAIPEDGRIIGCAGSFDRRKGVGHLIRAFGAASLAPTDRLLLVGRLSDDLRTSIERDHEELCRSGRLLLIDRFVSDVEFNAALAAMDVIAAPYLRHVGSSGLVVRGPAIGRPILGSAYGWIGRTIEQFELGWTCEIEDEPVLTRAIVRGLDEAPAYVVSERAKRFVQFHSIAQFQAAWTRRLRQRMGQPEAKMLEWDWVTG